MLFANLPFSRQMKSARQHILADLRKSLNLFRLTKQDAPRIRIRSLDVIPLAMSLPRSSPLSDITQAIVNRSSLDETLYPSTLVRSPNSHNEFLLFLLGTHHLWPQFISNRLQSLTSPDLPEYETPPPPAFLSAGAQHLYQQGIDYLHSQKCLYHSDLKPEDWLAAYGATIVPNFTEQILGALLDSSVLDEFASEIVEPLANRHDTTHVFQLSPSHTLCSTSRVDHLRPPPPHRGRSHPSRSDLVRVLPRDEFPSSGGWIDNIAEKIDHL